MVVGLRCVVCGEEVEISRPLSWTCPRATEADPFHVLEFVDNRATPTIEIDRGEQSVCSLSRTNGVVGIRPGERHVR